MIAKTTPITAGPFDQWRILSLNISVSPRDGKTSASATLVPTDGTHLLNEPLTINIADVAAEVQAIPALGTALAAVYAAVQAVGTAKGVL